MIKRLTQRTAEAAKPAAKPYEIFDPDLTGFLLRVQPSGKRNYYFAYKNKDGRRRRYRIGPADSLTSEQARDMAKSAPAGFRIMASTSADG